MRLQALQQGQRVPLVYLTLSFFCLLISLRYERCVAVRQFVHHLLLCDIFFCSLSCLLALQTVSKHPTNPGATNHSLLNKTLLDEESEKEGANGGAIEHSLMSRTLMEEEAVASGTDKKERESDGESFVMCTLISNILCILHCRWQR